MWYHNIYKHFNNNLSLISGSKIRKISVIRQFPGFKTNHVANLVLKDIILLILSIKTTAQKNEVFSKCEQIRRKLQTWSHWLKKSLMKNFIFLQWSSRFSKEKVWFYPGSLRITLNLRVTLKIYFKTTSHEFPMPFLNDSSWKKGGG